MLYIYFACDRLFNALLFTFSLSAMFSPEFCWMGDGIVVVTLR